MGGGPGYRCKALGEGLSWKGGWGWSCPFVNIRCMIGEGAAAVLRFKCSLVAMMLLIDAINSDWQRVALYLIEFVPWFSC